MKTPFIAGAALLLAATAVQAAPSESERYARWATARAGQLLHDHGLETRAQGASVRATVDPEGVMTGVSVLRNSGSPADDDAVAEVLKRVIRERPPAGLKRGAVTLNVRGATLAEGKAP
jgi:outer membrane biosynthesis protein TonB